MLYSQFYFKDKAKIPTPLAAVLILVVALFMGSVFLKTGPASLRASKKNAKRIEVTNLSPVQASVFWQSQGKEEGFIFFGDSLNAINTLALDDRDVAAKKSQYLNHYVTLRNLEASHTYFFKIVSNNQLIVKPDGTPFSFKTPTTLGASSSLSPAHGTVLKESLNGEENALVLLTVDNFYPMSSLTKSSGEWLIPLNSFFDKVSLENKIPPISTAVKIEIISEDNKNSVVTGRLNQLSPVSSTIIIGRNYDLGLEDNVLSAQSSRTATPSKTVDIIYPVEGALIPGRTPLIKGVALPQSQVFITINSSQTFSATLTADRNGNWSYLLPESLELGSHTIMIKTKDNQGQEVSLTRNFTIVASDNAGRVLGEATGSAALTGTPTLTPTPTSSLTPTVATTTTTPTIPVAGVSAFLPIIGGLSFIIAGLGILLVF